MSEAIVPFTLNTAQHLLTLEDRFPIDFDDAWRWLGYSTKQKAEHKLSGNFEEGIDYEFPTDRFKTPPEKGGRPARHIRLTVDCFKMLGMMAGTLQGKEVRWYFLECEKALKSGSAERVKEIEPRWEQILNPLAIAALNAEKETGVPAERLLDLHYLAESKTQSKPKTPAKKPKQPPNAIELKERILKLAQANSSGITAREIMRSLVAIKTSETAQMLLTQMVRDGQLKAIEGKRTVRYCCKIDQPS